MLILHFANRVILEDMSLRAQSTFTLKILLEVDEDKELQHPYQVQVCILRKIWDQCKVIKVFQKLQGEEVLNNSFPSMRWVHTRLIAFDYPSNQHKKHRSSQSSLDRFACSFLDKWFYLQQMLSLWIEYCKFLLNKQEGVQEYRAKLLLYGLGNQKSIIGHQLDSFLLFKFWPTLLHKEFYLVQQIVHKSLASYLKANLKILELRSYLNEDETLLSKDQGLGSLIMHLKTME